MVPYSIPNGYALSNKWLHSRYSPKYYKKKTKGNQRLPNYVIMYLLMSRNMGQFKIPNTLCHEGPCSTCNIQTNQKSVCYYLVIFVLFLGFTSYYSKIIDYIMQKKIL